MFDMMPVTKRCGIPITFIKRLEELIIHEV